MPDWFVQGKDWFIGPEAFIVLLGIGLVSGVVFCSVRWAIDRIAHLEAENARLSEKLRSAKWILDD